MSPSSSDTPPVAPSDRTTMTEVIAGYRDAGYTADFGAEPDARVSCGGCGTVSPAHRFAVESLRRMEGASDPDDMVAIVAAACPECGTRGTLVLGYGPSASPVDADVLAGLDDRRADDARSPRDAAPDETPASSADPGSCPDPSSPPARPASAVRRWIR